jgi:endo-1,4-beta-xylanase
MNVNNSIVDGDRITKAFETGIGANTAEGKQPYQVMMEFGEKRTIDTVNVISMQEEEAAKAGTGTPPNLSQTTSRAQQTYDVYYYDGEKWISFGAVKDIPESERKVWNAISRKEAVEAEKIRVDIYTSYYIRIVELEAVQTLRPDEPEEQPAESLKDAYTPLFGKVGTAVTSQQMSDESTMNFIKSQYNSISMENEMKPSYILGSKAVVQSTLPEGYIENDKYSYMDAQYLKMNFDTIDQCIEMAYEAGLKMRFHVLVWHQQTPEWFFKEDFSTAADAEYVDAETMNGRMEYYIQNVIHHIYNTAHGKDVVYSWDVVNEYTHNYNDKKKPHWDEVYYPDDVYDESEGKNYSGRNNPCYVIDAFKLAHEQLNILESQGKIASAEAIELYYNDFNEYIPDTRTAIIDLIHNINMEAGEKICDGIGMQMHLGIGYPSVKLIGDTIDIYQEEGFKMQMTEIDITCYESDNKTTEQHTQHWSDLFTMIVSKKNSGADINCITFWGLYDSVSWRKEGVPLLFADIDTPKDSYYAVLEAAK